MKTHKYIIHFNDSYKPGKAIPNWSIIGNPDAEAIFSQTSNMFKDSVVVLFQFSEKDRTLVLSTARGLLEIAKVVKLVKISDLSILDEKYLDSAPECPKSLLTMDDEDFASLTELQSSQILHQSQDYSNGVLYYGASINGIDMLVTSQKEMFSFAATASRDLTLLQTELSMSNLRHETVLDYFSNGVTVNPDKLFSDIREYFKKHIYFHDEETYDLVSIWVMGTYMYRAFRYFPYIHLNAEKGSGKTLLMELMSPLSFNGILMSQPVASTILKLISQNGSTLFIDEAEGLSQKQSGGNSQVKQILKTGFARSGQYYIGETMYRTYGPKCFAGINDLDDVLADRAITIKMMRKTVAERIELYRETPTMRVDQTNMRDRLYLFGLQYGPSIAKDYEDEKPFYDKLAHLTNRAYDVWVPLFRIATAFNSENVKMGIFTSLDKLSQLDGKRRKARDTEENETGSLISGLTEVFNLVQPYKEDKGISYYDPEILYAAMVKNEKIPKSMQRKSFSRLIKRTLEIESAPQGYNLTTKRMYVLDHKKFDEYKKRYADIIAG